MWIVFRLCAAVHTASRSDCAHRVKASYRGQETSRAFCATAAICAVLGQTAWRPVQPCATALQRVAEFCNAVANCVNAPCSQCRFYQFYTDVGQWTTRSEGVLRCELQRLEPAGSAGSWLSNWQMPAMRWSASHAARILRRYVAKVCSCKARRGRNSRIPPWRQTPQMTSVEWMQSYSVSKAMRSTRRRRPACQ